MASFGEVLKRYRQAKRLSQDALGAAAGISGQTISNIESGIVKAPMGNTYRSLVAALGLSVEQMNAEIESDLVEFPVPADLKRRIEASAKKAGLSVPDFFSLLVAMADTPAGRQALDRASRKRGKSRIKPAKAVHTASGELHYQK